MARGSGISFDSDHVGLFLHKPTVISPFSDQHLIRHHRKWKLEAQPAQDVDNMTSSSSPPPAGVQFPVILCSTHDNQHHPPAPSHGRPINEMNFFTDDKETLRRCKESAATTGDHGKDSYGITTELGFNINSGLLLLPANTSSDQSIVDDGISSYSDDKRAKNEFAVIKAELERVNEENKQLRDVLNEMTCSYNALQMHLVALTRQKQKQEEEDGQQNLGEGQTVPVVPRQITDLGLAPASKTNDLPRALLRDNLGSPKEKNSNNLGKKGEESPDPGPQTWGPNKVARSNSLKSTEADVDQATEATIRKARVSVRARLEQPMIADGCQWRKYGQKMAKGNPCPRAYYRCTMAAACPVRKQVQRCAEDRTILITTYEGNHNHPLPPTAVAMASTTSSAARMLLSGSMPSADGTMNPNLLARSLLSPLSSSSSSYPSSNLATISAAAPFPTVTLDLTQNPRPDMALLPQFFGQVPYNQSKLSPIQTSRDAEGAGQFGQRQLLALPPAYHHVPPVGVADTVSALKADPNFTAALAVAISSMIGGSQGNNAGTRTFSAVRGTEK